MQNGTGVQERLVAAIEPVAAAQGLEVVEVAWLKESGRQILRIFIDKPGGITHDDCAALSRAVDAPLEALALAAYVLEVSSPGAERPLRTDHDFERYCGRQVQLKLSAPIDGTKTLQGILRGHDAETVQVEVAGQMVAVPRTTLKAARLALVMPGSEEKTEGGRPVVEL